MNNDKIYSIALYIKVSNANQYTYVNFNFNDCHKLVDEDFFNRIKEDAIIGVKQEYKMDGNLVAEFVEEEEYKKFKAESSVHYDILPNDVKRTEKTNNCSFIFNDKIKLPPLEKRTDSYGKMLYKTQKLIKLLEKL